MKFIRRQRLDAQAEGSALRIARQDCFGSLAQRTIQGKKCDKCHVCRQDAGGHPTRRGFLPGAAIAPAQAIHPQQSDDRLDVCDAAAFHPFQRRGERERHNLQKLAVVVRVSDVGQVARQEKFDPFVGIAYARMQRRQMLPARRGVAALLDQLALRGCQRFLARLDLAGGSS